MKVQNAILTRVARVSRSTCGPLPTHAAPHAPTPRRCLRIGALHLELVVALAIACTEVSGPCVLRWMWLQKYLRALDVCLQAGLANWACGGVRRALNDRWTGDITWVTLFAVSMFPCVSAHQG